MNINNIIKGRRSIRRYKLKKVSRKLLKSIIEAARWAPSVHNFQPWRFIVIEGKSKQKLIGLLKKQQQGEVLFVRLILKNSIKVIENAPVAILVYQRKDFSKRIESGGRRYVTIANILEVQSVACAIENILLAAHSLGLGGVWLGIFMFREKQINKLFKINDKLMAILTIGYPNERPKAPSRKPLPEIADFKN